MAAKGGFKDEQVKIDLLRGGGCGIKRVRGGNVKALQAGDAGARGIEHRGGEGGGGE